ncbi:hypothetical protein RirG_256030 [Rhizophagus irregularis DAOM 197198w]|uniref:Uncharacterized protein n=1 Tax=Rhizophagus irregularis (strain DAOM 197198w) TaxID=1432141 RepID=A0A015IDW6_RHIIW|nr:hypothetical protein RirG_256030 [Rhizophagus irregularis DAOM 197198w]
MRYTNFQNRKFLCRSPKNDNYHVTCVYTRSEGSEVIALDPDVRTFMTGYDPSGIAVEWGKNDIGQLSHIMSCYVTYSQEDPLSL